MFQTQQVISLSHLAQKRTTSGLFNQFCKKPVARFCWPLYPQETAELKHRSLFHRPEYRVTTIQINEQHEKCLLALISQQNQCSIRSRGICVVWYFIDGAVTCTLDPQITKRRLIKWNRNDTVFVQHCLATFNTNKLKKQSCRCFKFQI